MVLVIIHAVCVVPGRLLAEGEAGFGDIFAGKVVQSGGADTFVQLSFDMPCCKSINEIRFLEIETSYRFRLHILPYWVRVLYSPT